MDFTFSMQLHLENLLHTCGGSIQGAVLLCISTSLDWPMQVSCSFSMDVLRKPGWGGRLYKATTGINPMLLCPHYWTQATY